MRVCYLIVIVICLSFACVASERELSAFARLQHIGKLEVLAGRVRIAHYGKDVFPWGSSISAAYLGEATYKIAVDFSKARQAGEDCLELPKPSFWCQIEEGKTRMYESCPWTSGIITDEDRKEFVNRQLSCIDAKVEKAVGEESELMKQAQDQAARIAQVYLFAWGRCDKTLKVDFK